MPVCLAIVIPDESPIVVLGTLESKSMTDCMGYAHPLYAQSLEEFGEPRELPLSGGWILVRPIPDTPFHDAMGCYPLFVCQDWKRLQEDLENVGSDLVSLTLVIDPFSEVSIAELKACFNFVNVFKTHYIVNFSDSLGTYISKKYRYYARRALRVMDVEVCDHPSHYLDDWIRLYDNLILKHGITGINAFSRRSFEIQLRMPGILMLVGKIKGQVVGANLLLVQGKNAYSHLAAYNSDGYRIAASYGIYWTMLTHLIRSGFKYLNLGAGAGLVENPRNGLAKFKKGWSNEKRPVILCGLIIDHQKYEGICKLKRVPAATFFPAYRAAEFGSLSTCDRTAFRKS